MGLKTSLTTLLALAAFAASPGSAQVRSYARQEQPVLAARLALQMRAADTNGDGIVTPAELHVLPGFAQSSGDAASFDQDGNGGLNGLEIDEAARMAAVGLVLSCDANSNLRSDPGEEDCQKRTAPPTSPIP